MRDDYLQPAMELHGRRILFVVPPARFDEAAFYQTWTLLAEEGAWLAAAAASPTGFAVGEEGARERVADPATLSARDFDAIVLVGGQTPAGPAAKALLSRASAAGVLIAAIGDADLDGIETATIADVRRLPRFVAELAVKLRRAARRPSAPSQERPGL
jgi:hypothetical protein